MSILTDLDPIEVEKIFVQVWSDHGCEMEPLSSLDIACEHIAKMILTKMHDFFPQIVTNKPIPHYKVHVLATKDPELHVSRSQDHVSIRSVVRKEH